MIIIAPWPFLKKQTHVAIQTIHSCIFLIISIIGINYSTCTLSARAANEALINQKTPTTSIHENESLSIQGSVIFKQYEQAIVRVRGVFSEVDDDAQSKLNLQIGSGFFINATGEILTTATVALNAHRVWVEHKGIKYPAKFCSADPATNTALLKILELPKYFDYIPLLPQTPIPTIGEKLYGITAPFECKTSLSEAIVSSYEADYGAHSFPVYHLRSCIGQYPGEGGSPVFDQYGRCIGMVTHTALALNAAYILPIPTLVYVKEQLSLQDKIPHGYLGVEFTLKETMGELPSILIAKIMPESPAAKGGLKAHDQILKINDQAIESMADLRQATFHLQPGQMIQITLNRQSQIKILTIKLD